MSSRPTIAERIRELLTRRGIDAKDLAAAIKVAPRTMSNWTGGTTEPRALHIARIADHFGVSADYLVGRCDAESGLVPGTWIINLDEYDRPTGRDDLAYLVPPRTKVVTHTRCKEMEREAQERAEGQQT